ncbi:7176_t:CDS:2, partial [Cetraspora pellucida]
LFLFGLLFTTSKSQKLILIVQAFMAHNDLNTNNIIIQDDIQQVLDKEHDFTNINDTTFFLAEEMDKLSTKIYKKNTFSYTKEVKRSKASYRLVISKFICTTSKIQDRRNPVSKNNTKTKELHDKDRYKECFLSHPISLFIKDLYQDSKTDNKASESSGDQINHLLRRHHNNDRIRKASYRAYQESLWDARLPWIHNKQQKITINTNVNNKISWLQGELNQHVFQDFNKKNQRYHLKMQETEGYKSSSYSQASSLIRQDECYNRSLFTSKTFFKSFIQKQEQSSEMLGLECEDSIISREQETIRVLDKKP